MISRVTVRHMGIAALILSSFAITGTTLVALTFTSTKDIIAENERRALLSNLNALVPRKRYDNVLEADFIRVIEPKLLGTAEPVTMYRAYRGGRPVAILGTPVAPDGYSGPIKLLVGVYVDGTLAGVRVLSHRETPGLGDAIDIPRSDWIRVFDGKSLRNPSPEYWMVKRDGGAFDQFTGATVTPRAVVKATRKFLEYFQKNRNQLFLARSVEKTQ
jgi:electron transport complex protein RnfG